MLRQNDIIILKFGGAAVRAPELFHLIADIILGRLNTYKKLVVVVSAMGNTTNELIELAHKVHPEPPRRELDMMVSVGERISVALLAMALSFKNCDAVSLTGSQSGIITSSDHFEAKIINVKPHRVLRELEKHKVVIVAGYQGVSEQGEITTLGRGGSDTTAVALAVALGARTVEFFKDVDGVYDKDPKKDENAKRCPTLTYEEMFNLASLGAKVLHDRSVLLAQKNAIRLHVLPFLDPNNENKGTWITPPSKPEEDYIPRYEIFN
jgi:aspartate kinase